MADRINELEQALRAAEERAGDAEPLLELNLRTKSSETKNKELLSEVKLNQDKKGKEALVERTKKGDAEEDAGQDSSKKPTKERNYYGGEVWDWVFKDLHSRVMR